MHRSCDLAEWDPRYARSRTGAACSGFLATTADDHALRDENCVFKSPVAYLSAKVFSTAPATDSPRACISNARRRGLEPAGLAACTPSQYSVSSRSQIYASIASSFSGAYSRET